MTDYYISLRSETDDKEPGRLRYLTFQSDDDPEVELDPNVWIKALQKEFPPSPGLVDGVLHRSGDVLFLVHGFNVSGADARKFHLKCAGALALLGWPGRVVSFDWPSDGLVFAYLNDRSHARTAASSLVDVIGLLEGVQSRDCTINVNVLAHSMGCFVVQQGFAWAYQDVPPDWRIGQLIMAAADVDYTVFSANNFSAKQFGSHSARLTAYTNRYDAALAASNAKRLELTPRMGRVGLPDDAPATMCEINCSALFQSSDPGTLATFDPSRTHSFYFDQPLFWNDVLLTLKGEIDRREIPNRAIDDKATVPNRFVLAAPQVLSLTPRPA